jgi:hypothetical protein
MSNTKAEDVKYCTKAEDVKYQGRGCQMQIKDMGIKGVIPFCQPFWGCLASKF